MLYEELSQIQKMLEGNEYTDGGVSYYIEIDRLDSSVPMSVALKWKLAALRVAPSSEIELNIEKIEAPTEEMKRLSGEWYFDEEISGRMLGLLANNEEIKKAHGGNRYRNGCRNKCASCENTRTEGYEKGGEGRRKQLIFRCNHLFYMSACGNFLNICQKRSG